MRCNRKIDEDQCPNDAKYQVGTLVWPEGSDHTIREVGDPGNPNAPSSTSFLLYLCPSCKNNPGIDPGDLYTPEMRERLTTSYREMGRKKPDFDNAEWNFVKL
jgi:hypothetical protein